MKKNAAEGYKFVVYNTTTGEFWGGNGQWLSLASQAQLFNSFDLANAARFNKPELVVKKVRFVVEDIK